MTKAIHQEVCYILQRYIRDPRLQNVTITTVKLSAKLDYADIQVTQLNAQYTPTETVTILNKAALKIKHCMAERSRTYKVPKLRFHYDLALEKEIRLRQLINQTIDLR